ncbi:Protein of unknown function [Bacillus mycoides]|uniref:Uncharacterized protein n=1 Tax=Bacillus mycoides TaxID=1405 RepID=A0A1C4BX17_BACMY|nr:Protein of unknown function [Bacillus mycoides]SCC11466.1 Protein of unknown function [Bacillus mycoides]SCM86446.1 Protein of unknown function [Bacillus mycoides]
MKELLCLKGVGHTAWFTCMQC